MNFISQFMPWAAPSFFLCKILY